MKKLLSSVLALTMGVTCVAGLAACGGGKGEGDAAVAAKAIDFVKSIYDTTDQYEDTNYELLKQWTNADTHKSYDINWSVSSVNAGDPDINDYLSIDESTNDEDYYIVSVVSMPAVDIEYNLTASVTVNKATDSYDIVRMLRGAANIMTVADINELEPSDFIPVVSGTYTNYYYSADGNEVTPVMVQGYVVDPGNYSSDRYNQIYIADEYSDSADTFYVYRVSKDSAYLTGNFGDIEYGDLVTFSGYIQNYSGGTDKIGTLELTYYSTTDAQCVSLQKNDSLTDAQRVSAAKKMLGMALAQTTFTQVTTAETAIALPTVSCGANVSWSVKETTEHVTVSGNKLNIVSLPSEETTYTLVATITCGNASEDTKEISITVFGVPELSDDLIHATLSFESLTNRVWQDGDSQIWQQNGITFTNLKGSSTNAVANYYAPVRLYAKSTVKIEYNGIVRVILHSNNGYADALETTLQATDYDYVRAENDFTILIGEDSPVNVVEFSIGGSQCRLDSIEVYAVMPGDQEIVDAEKAKVEAALEEIDGTYLSEVDETVELPTAENGVEIEWTVTEGDATLVEIEDGVVTVVKLPATDNETLTITGTLTKGEGTATVTFEITIESELGDTRTPAEKVAAALAAVELEQTTFTEVDEELELPTSVDGIDGVVLTWTVQDHTELVEIVSGKLNIKALPAADTVVTLKVTATCGEDATNNKDVTITVKADAELLYGSLEHPLTSAAALALAKSLASGTYSAQEVYATGYVIGLGSWSTQYSNFTGVYIADSYTSDTTGTDVLYLYRLYPDNTFISGEADLVLGAKITVYGYLQNYQGTSPQMTYNGTSNPVAVAYTAPTDEAKVAVALAALPESLPNVTTAADVTLPVSTVTGVTFAWESDNTTYTVSEGKLVVASLPTSDDVTVTLTVTATCGDVSTNNTKTVTVTIKKTVAEAYFVKITSTDAIVNNGTYLIVYEGTDVGPLVFDGSRTALDAEGNKQAVTISDSKIVAENVMDYAFTISAVSGGYSIKSASGYYIGQNSDANGLASSQTTVYTNTITFESGNVTIKSSGGAYLRYNSATSNGTRFRYYKSTSYTNQQPIALYLLVE